MTENNDKLDNMTVRRFAKLIKGNGSNNGSTGITTGTVIQNDNQLFVAVDDETLVPVSDTASNVNVGDKVTLAIDNEEALIVGNNSDASPTASELSETDTKATFAKVDASEAKDTAQTAQVTANTAQNTAETAQTTADNAQSTATEAKETADAVDGKATEAKETATQAQATATTASETATQAQTTANTAKETADTASTKADNAQSTADTASTKADNAQSTADTASSKADTAQTTANQAVQDADDAKKVATNYIKIDDNKGITVGDMTAGTLGKNTYVNSEGFYIKDGETALASFEDDKIALGINGNGSTISLCDDTMQIVGGKDGCEFTSGGYVKFFIERDNKCSSLAWGTDWLQCAQATKGQEKNTTDIWIEDSGIGVGGDSDTAPHLVVADGDNLEGYIKASNIYQGDDKVSVEGHTHVKDDITDFAHTHTKSDITDFSHTHTKSEISDFAHNHAGDALTPATINTTSTIKQNGTQVSLQGHTHEAKDLTTSTPIFKKTSISTTYTCAANKGIAVSQTLPTMTGYTPFCLQGWGTNSGYMLCREYYISAAGKIVVDMYNVSSSSITNKLTCNLIYVKDGWF